MEDKTFINGLFIREKEFDNGGSIIKVDINVNTLFEQLQALKNDKGFVSIELKKRREKSENGLSHYAELNTFVPKEQHGSQNKKDNTFHTSDDDEGLPF
tara:strand:+ start:1054 stop:1350 length:297 start_codon:yes stop_codon:yes gene_type:complete